MNFKPGDKVWIDNSGGKFPAGTYAGVLVTQDWIPGWWVVDIEGITVSSDDGTIVHEIILRPRNDPPPQQQPVREATGDWDLCPWRPTQLPEKVT